MSGLAATRNKLAAGAKAVRTLGVRWAADRLRFQLEHRSGVLLRRTPVCSWDDYQLRGRPHLRRVTPGVEAAGEYLRTAPPDVERELRGRLEQLKARQFDVFGTTCLVDSWHSEFITPASYPPDRHWSEVAELADADLKLVWEPSRFAWAYDLVRLHALDPDSAAGDVFWQLFEDWCANNRPNAGVNWKCGQESAIRLMAVLFAVQVFDRDQLSEDRQVLLAKFADVTAARISAHWRYARSQNNNHIISEAVGLVSVGLLFPDLERADRYRFLGEQLLRETCQELVMPDGGTSQYSLNYHRVFMDNFIWALWLYRSLAQDPPVELVSALRRSHDFLLAITDTNDGSAGNWGNNDGALLLPLSSCGFLDMRPTLAMAAQLLRGASYRWSGPAEESVRWLAGRPGRYLPDSPPPDGVTTTVFPYAGISVMTNGPHRALIRGGPHQLFRPPQCDFGHVELWVDGQQVVFDPGTLSYKPRAGEPDLGLTRFHNGPSPQRGEQMTRLGRFLWADWPTVRIDQRCDDAGSLRMEIDLQTTPPVRASRTITPMMDGWRISDEVDGAVTVNRVDRSVNDLSPPPHGVQAYRRRLTDPEPPQTGSGRSG